ncbi:hypothetical protein ACJX0J_017608, partial [Zea mays]
HVLPDELGLMHKDWCAGWVVHHLSSPQEHIVDMFLCFAMNLALYSIAVVTIAVLELLNLSTTIETNVANIFYIATLKRDIWYAQMICCAWSTSQVWKIEIMTDTVMHAAVQSSLFFGMFQMGDLHPVCFLFPLGLKLSKTKAPALSHKFMNLYVNPQASEGGASDRIMNTKFPDVWMFATAMYYKDSSAFASCMIL